jgi:carboxypeptidase C (cathepsin A)
LTNLPQLETVSFPLPSNCGMYANFSAARSLLPTLSDVVKSGITTVLYAGDADMVCDWMGGLACADAVEYNDQHEFKNQAVKNYTVNGKVAGTFKREGGLSWLRVFECGHYVGVFSKQSGKVNGSWEVIANIR